MTLHAALMADDTPLPPSTRHQVLLGVARAMSYLHAQEPPVIHRDLKPENVLVMEDFQPKLADFGSSREAASLSTTMIGTPLFAAPEVLGQQAYGMACDVWSFGCLTACVLARSLLLQGGMFGFGIKILIDWLLPPLPPGARAARRASKAKPS